MRSLWAICSAATCWTRSIWARWWPTVCGLHGIEAAKVEAACASGAAALRVGTMAVASGFHDIVIVAGLEKMTDTVGKDTTAGLATAADAEYEALHGVSFVGLNALIMQRYMYEYDVPLDAFAGFSINAHRNGANNPNAMFQEAIAWRSTCRAPVIATPINIMDSSPVCDGSAALVLVPDGVGAQVHHRPPSWRRADSGQRQRQRHAGRPRPPRSALSGGSQRQQPEGVRQAGVEPG